MNKKTSGFKSLMSYFLDVKRKEVFKGDFQKIIDSVDTKYNSMADYELLLEYPELEKKIEEICKEYQLHEKPFKWVLIDRIIDGDWDNDNIHKKHYGDLCELEFPETTEGGHINQEYKDDIRSFPITINISAYASLNNIKDFLSRNNSKIKELQKLYKKENIDLGSVRSRPNIEVNDIVYENREKSNNEIMRLLVRQGHDIDEGAVGKILSIEKERRN